ncbi:MAG: hypothetical protein LBN02_04700 [Oscillospiraceae bacterium]|nr:hypothetical protein [Oscillospiraceae bacterium]
MQTMKPNAKGLSGRLLCVFLALMVLFSTAIVFRASAEDSAILTVGSVTVPLGTASVQVPVLVSNNTGVVSVSLQFTYSGLTLTAATNNAFDNITRNLPLGIINTYSDENLVGDFQFYVLTFAVTNPNIDKTYTIGVGTTDGRPNNFSAVKENGSVSATPVTFVAGSITVGTPSSDTPQVAGEVWDGSVDVTWYNTTDTVFYIDTPAKLEGLAAIVNGSYNTGATVYGDDDHTKIVQTRVADYGYGADFFDEKTIYITADLDFGGVKNAQGVWSGENNYMPIGGQYNMTLGDDNSHLSSSFNGTLDGLGHELKNIYCERADMTTTGAEPYKMSQSIGVVGRLGVHDGDPTDWRAFEPTVRNLVVGAGYISGRRSVGGIVGKTGKTQYNTDAVNGGRGAIVENVANYADIHGTDSKGTGGIVGASWNGGIILNSYNFGTITNGYTAPTGGISGYNENVITNAYNVGSIQGGGSNYSMAIGSNNGGQPVVYNAYYLIGSAAGGGYYSSGLQDSGIARTA